MNRENRFWASLLALNDILCILAAWGLAYWLRFRSGLIALPEGNVVHPLDMYAGPVLFSFVIFYWSLKRQSAYQLRGRNWSFEVRAILQGVALAGPLLIALIYLRYWAIYSRLVMGLFLAFSPLILTLGRYLVRLGVNHWLTREHTRRRVVVLGSETGLQEILPEYLSYHPEVVLVRTLEIERAEELSLEVDRPDEVLIIFPQLQSLSLETVLKRLEAELIDITFIPDWGSFRVLGYDIEQVGCLPLIHLRRSPLHGWGLIGKRIMDVTIALAAIILTLPLTVLIGLMIWITSGRPIIYSQMRMGFDGRIFKIFKFRSMVVDAERKAEAQWTQRDDPRRTRLGVWLRRGSLDELPQLYNILRGDMSLVGPRPEMAHLVEEFKQHIPHYYLRHKVKAGLTGWAQVHGLRGNTSLQQRIDYDLYYIEHWSLWLDIKILVLTLVRGWSNAY